MTAQPDIVARPRLEPTHLPRVLAGPREDGGSLAAHLDTFGPLPPLASAAQFVADVDESRLLGRGGAGFPTAVKIRAVAEGRGPRVVVVNGAEGEPLSRKDALLLAERPHLVLDGALVAAETVDADEIIVAVDHAHTRARAGIERAVEERSRKRRARPTIRVVGVPSHYIAGEESALVHFLNGGDAKPTFVPPRPFERGVRRRPTLVQNVETVAQLALLARFGPSWFRAVGAPEEPGTVLVTISGAVARPGVVEIATGTTADALVGMAGGLTEDASAFLVGGYFGTWIPAGVALALPLSQHALRAAGAGLGCGVVHVFPARACPLAEVARIATWMAEETAGQCGPCVYGLAAIANEMTALVDRRDRGHAADRIARWVPQIAGRGACRYPDGATKFVASALEVFAHHVDTHRARRACPYVDDPPRLPLREPRDRTWR
jgi:NADH:ubiquinone oxidoreductase subunit F (NADH-binding)